MSSEEKLDLILNKLESLEATLFFMQEKIDHFEAGYIEPIEIKTEIHNHINTAAAEIKEELASQTSYLTSQISFYS